MDFVNECLVVIEATFDVVVNAYDKSKVPCGANT